MTSKPFYDDEAPPPPRVYPLPMAPSVERGLPTGLVLRDLFTSLRVTAEADATSLRSPGNTAPAPPAPAHPIQVPIQVPKPKGKGPAGVPVVGRVAVAVEKGAGGGASHVHGVPSSA